MALLQYLSISFRQYPLSSILCFRARSTLTHSSLFPESVNGVSATKAGTYLLSFIIVQVIFVITSGKVVALMGRYKPLVVIGPLLVALGAGLIYSANFSTQLSRVLGVQVFCGIGVAAFLQNVLLAVQVEMRSEPRLISRAVGLVNFWAFL